MKESAPGAFRANKESEVKTIMILAMALTAGHVMAQSHTKSGYVKKDGTYVAPSVATNPDNSKLNNYSSKGNTNPYTGKEGTVDPYKIDLPKPKK